MILFSLSLFVVSSNLYWQCVYIGRKKKNSLVSIINRSISNFKFQNETRIVNWILQITLNFVIKFRVKMLCFLLFGTLPRLDKYSLNQLDRQIISQDAHSHPLSRIANSDRIGFIWYASIVKGEEQIHVSCLNVAGGGSYLNLACRGLEDVWSGDLFGGDKGEDSPSSTTFSSSSLMEGSVNDGPFTSDSCWNSHERRRGKFRWIRQPDRM